MAILYIQPEKLMDGWLNKEAILHWHSDSPEDGFISKPNSDRKWLTDKDDRCNANVEKTCHETANF